MPEDFENFHEEKILVIDNNSKKSAKIQKKSSRIIHFCFFSEYINMTIKYLKFIWRKVSEI